MPYFTPLYNDSVPISTSLKRTLPAFFIAKNAHEIRAPGYFMTIYWARTGQNKNKGEPIVAPFFIDYLSSQLYYSK